MNLRGCSNILDGCQAVPVKIKYKAFTNKTTLPTNVAFVNFHYFFFFSIIIVIIFFYQIFIDKNVLYHIFSSSGFHVPSNWCFTNAKGCDSDFEPIVFTPGENDVIGNTITSDIL